MDKNTGLKKMAAKEAVSLIKDGMVIGLGTGTTASHAIKEIGRRIREEGLKITGIPTSRETERLAFKEGILLTTLDKKLPDITIDGIDSMGKGFLIKGAGGALTREKIVAYASKTLIIIADESKLSNEPRKTRIPIEIVPFSLGYVLAQLLNYGHVEMRTKEAKNFITDNGNYIIDLYPAKKPTKKWEAELDSITGVVTNGIFTKKCNIIVATKNGIKHLKI